MNHQILIIDDDDLFVDTVSFVLEQQEYDVLTAADGKEGTQLAEEHRPDLILCDVRMQNMHGYDTVAILRSRSKTQKIPIIMMTGYASPYGERRSQMAGADYYLSKPIQVQDLISTINMAMAQGARKGRSSDVIFPSGARGKP
ncbi:MAG: response regulator [Bacteroidetes bacterium]|jgi:CheY-like chemotaxis protein|nr:response regulator [Bacteroidota bacterium]